MNLKKSDRASSGTFCKSAIAVTSQLVKKRVKRSYPVGNRSYII
ncbi:hypothetical protein QUA42_00530 [Microcoleus sp. Pol11C2]